MMHDIFERLDAWNSRLNFFTPVRYWRITLTIFSLVVSGLWLLLGFDSGIGMVTRLLQNFPALVLGQITYGDWVSHAYEVYGITFHLSTFVIYGFMFRAVSLALEGLRIKGSKNLICALLFVGMNAALFENWYMLSFFTFQNNHFTTLWYSDRVFVMMYVFCIFGGSYSTIYVWANGYVESGHSFLQVYKWKPNKKFYITILLLASAMLLWYFYPFSTQTYVLKDNFNQPWTTSRFFPQTVYPNGSGIHDLVYSRNDLLHGVNVSVKALFAVVAWMFLKQFRRVKYGS